MLVYINDHIWDYPTEKFNWEIIDVQQHPLFARFHGLNAFDLGIEVYDALLQPVVGSPYVAQLIGEMVLAIHLYNHEIGWYFDKRCIYGLDVGTKVVISYGKFKGFTGTISGIRIENASCFIDCWILTAHNSMLLLEDIHYKKFANEYRPLVKFGCDDSIIRLNIQQYVHCFAFRHCI